MKFICKNLFLLLLLYCITNTIQENRLEVIRTVNHYCFTVLINSTPSFFASIGGYYASKLMCKILLKSEGNYQKASLVISISASWTNELLRYFFLNLGIDVYDIIFAFLGALLSWVVDTRINK